MAVFLLEIGDRKNLHKSSQKTLKIFVTFSSFLRSSYIGQKRGNVYGSLKNRNELQ